jgi:tripartite-type tricarboxylate transporter receptor subunit TctC
MHNGPSLKRDGLALFRVLAVGGLILAPYAAVALTDDANALFAGKTLKLIVGMPPGGGVDAYARLVQRHLTRHLAGAPAMVVQNLPGAGSQRSVMALDNAPPDGTIIATFSSALITEAIFAPERVKVDFRNFAFIGNVGEDLRVCYVRSASGVRNWHELLARDRINFGATAAGTSGNVDAAIMRNLFGVKLRMVQGYAGSADKQLALEKGEIDGDCGGWTSIPEAWLTGRKINIVVRLSPTPVDGLDQDVPFAGDLLVDERDRRIYDFLMAPERLGRLFMVSASVPPDRLAALRAAFDRTVADADFLADAQKLRLLVTPMSGRDVDREVAKLYATPPDLVRRARAMATE